MTNQEAIKYLQQLYPNGGHCWLDEQRIEAIGMAVKALQEEPESIWHDANEKSDNPEAVVIINPSDNTGEVLTKCISVYQGHIWAYTSVLLNLDNPCKTGKALQEESVSDDLGDYIYELSKQFPEVSFAKLSRIAVRVAKWQQERDEADRAAVYKCGWNDRKAMMMKKSFDAKILPANIEETEFCLDDYEEVSIITKMVNKG